jgi:folate-dependent phosphoribosylglycinamide formyltransferase PurN
VRLVLLTAHNPEGEVQHRYVARRLAQAFPNELVGIVVATGVSRTLPEKIKRWWRRYTIKEIASRLTVKLIHGVTGEPARKQQRISSILFPDGEDGRMPRRDILKHVESHNSDVCLAIIRDLQPDIVAIYGTLVIGRKLIASIPRGINIHTGISPRYRGSDTNFWPVYNEEPEHLGVTVHRLDAGIDSGAILARGRPNIARLDDEHVIFARAVQLGADLLCGAIRREHAGRANPLPQNLDKGREYRSVERTVQAEAKVRKLLSGGILGEGFSEWREEY